MGWGPAGPDLNLDGTCLVYPVIDYQIHPDRRSLTQRTQGEHRVNLHPLCCYTCEICLWYSLRVRVPLRSLLPPIPRGDYLRRLQEGCSFLLENLSSKWSALWKAEKSGRFTKQGFASLRWRWSR